MSELHPINRTLLSVLGNQIARTAAAFEGLRDDVFVAEPGGECNSIQRIGRHLINLRKFQLMLLESNQAAKVSAPESVSSIDELLRLLDSATALLRQAIAEHDPNDWYAVPSTPREGKWGDEPTIMRLVRPLNDFTNHLGAARAIRRVMGNGAERTQ